METNTQRGKHLYNRGWLGLIPLIGALVGIWLIFLGATKFKNKKLIVIGATAVMPTVVFYSSMNYYFQYSYAFRKDYSTFCQPQLNELIKSIEFYKIENGQYPNSLDDLLKTSSLVQVDDPIAQNKDENKGQFYYKRLDSNYILFSSGIDRIPYNDDDIFPSANFFDNGKTGLVRRSK